MIETKSARPVVEAAIALGSNVGNRSQHLRDAVALLQAELETCGELSHIYQTPAIDCPEPFPFLNAVWVFPTRLAAPQLLATCIAIEQKLGRHRTYPNAPRTVDLDVLYWGTELFQEPELSLPHPRMHQRLFVLLPLAELRPNWFHPGLKTSLAALLETNLAANPDHGIQATTLRWPPCAVTPATPTL